MSSWVRSGQEYLDMCESVNLKGLCTYESGFRCLTNSKRDVRSVEDVKGLKIRVMENDIHVALWQALGADAAPMAWGDAFTAMQQGALDGPGEPPGFAGDQRCSRDQQARNQDRAYL